jgi:hypothetical protein
MTMVYTSSLATPGNSACSGTPNTETDAIFLRPAAAVPARNVLLQAAYVLGKGAGLTAISGIVFRIMRATTSTVSTGGVATTPQPKDAGMAAATATAFTGATTPSSTGRTNHVVFGCGAAGPGGWVAPNPDSVIAVLSAATQPSLDLLAASGTAYLNYEFSIEHQE